MARPMHGMSQAFNSLVDQCSIEKNCLFASKEEAEKACLKGRSGSYEVKCASCRCFVVAVVGTDHANDS